MNAQLKRNTNISETTNMVTVHRQLKKETSNVKPALIGFIWISLLTACMLMLFSYSLDLFIQTIPAFLIISCISVFRTIEYSK